MTKTEFYNNKPTIAYYSGLNGLEIKEIIYSTNEYIISISGAWSGKKRYHKNKVYYNNSGSYIIIHGYRIPLNECVKVYN